jgi:transposase
MTFSAKLEVTEHQAQMKVCGRCGTKNKAQFPAGVNALVQYGAGIRAVAAYLMGYQLLPYERCAEAMSDLFRCHLSAGTVATLFRECSGEEVCHLNSHKLRTKTPASDNGTSYLDFVQNNHHLLL